MPPTLGRPKVLLLLLRAPMGAPDIVYFTVALSCNGVETLICAPSIIVRAIALRRDSVEAPT